jgi:hypothetical protein
VHGSISTTALIGKTRKRPSISLRKPLLPNAVSCG